MSEGEYIMLVAQSKKFGNNNINAYLKELNGRNNQG